MIKNNNDKPKKDRSNLTDDIKELQLGEEETKSVADKEVTDEVKKENEKEVRVAKPAAEERKRSVKTTVKVLSNFREGPSMSSNILATINPKDKIEVIGEDNTGEFCKVKYEGKTGYIKKDLCILDK